MRAHEFILENDAEHSRTLQRTGMWGKMGAGCLLLARDTGRIGIAKRSPYVQSPGTLGTVGGAIDTDKPVERLTEDEIVAAVHKEVDEELGYRGEMRLIKLMTAQIPTRDGSTFYYFNYLAVVPQEFKPRLNWENDALLWMTLEELQQQEGLHRGVRGLLNDSASMARIRAAMGSNSANKTDDTVNENVLNEGATDRLFYYRRLNGALRTLEDGYFSFSSSTGTGVEEKYTPPGKPFFLSTTRSKVGDYHRWVGDSAVMFNLDGRWIEQRYQVEPMDYWYAGKTQDTLKRGEWKTLDPTSKRAMWDYPSSGRTSESEDRIFSSKNTMPLTPVTAIHVFFAMDKLADEKNDQIRTFGAYVNRIIKLCQKRDIPVFIYKDVNDWKTQNPKRRISLDYVMKLTANLKMPEQRQSMRWMGPWIELIKAGKTGDLSKEGDRLRYNMMYYSDTIEQLNNDLHNARKPGGGDYEDVVFINQFMIKNKLKNTRELMDYLKDKWKNIYNIENPREREL